MTGVIARVAKDRGFGFIRPDGVRGSEGDVFFHRSALTHGGFDALREGDAVVFREANNGKGPRAEDVIVTGD